MRNVSVILYYFFALPDELLLFSVIILPLQPVVYGLPMKAQMPTNFLRRDFSLTDKFIEC